MDKQRMKEIDDIWVNTDAWKWLYFISEEKQQEAESVLSNLPPHISHDIYSRLWQKDCKGYKETVKK